MCLDIPGIVELFVNSENPDQMQHFAVSDLGLHYLLSYPFRGLQTTIG